MDEAWFSSFVPSSTNRDDKPRHRRQTSLLQPVNDPISNGVVVDSALDDVDDVDTFAYPPKADCLPRASSWHNLVKPVSDIYTKAQPTRRKSIEPFDVVLNGDQSTDDGYTFIEDDLFLASHEDYELYHDQLELSQNHLNSLLDSTNTSLKLLASLAESFHIVEEQTNTFYQRCQSIVAEQKRMTKLADDMKENLQYYAYLEPITRRLNAPGATNVVTRSEFPEMLANLDSCLDYMQGHPSQREAATYQSRYRLLLTRALTLIRVHFTETLRALAADVSKRIGDKQLNEATQSALLYAKFRVTAPELRDLGLEILKRAVPPAHAEADGEAEYQSLMNELYQSYSATRGRIMLPIVAKKMSEVAAVDSSVRDLVSFARGAIGFIRGICLDEYDLWCEWFVVDGAVYEFLESMCEPLFDYVRPRIIHETKLSKLCELCTFLQTSFVDSEDDDDVDDDLNNDYKGGHQVRKLNFAQLVQPALADAQNRLVFLAMSVLRDDIEHYKPKAGDLAYPRAEGRRASTGVNGRQPVLSGRKATKNSTEAPAPAPVAADKDDADLDEGHWANIDKSGTVWYPTLPKAVRLLSRIYRLVNSTVFDDLAHRIVHSTTLSLVSAASEIATKVSPTDSNLFLISHLLRLKEQIVAFDIEFVAPEIMFDFSSLTNTFYELRDRGGLWNPNTWYKLASGGLLPRVVENMLDAKAELDGRLRTVINDFVNSFSTRITAPLTELSEPQKAKGTPMDPQRATTAVRGLVEKDVAFLRKKLEEYIGDLRTREVLIAAVKDQVILAYEDWMDQQAEGKGVVKLGKLSKKGKGREDEIWSSDVFADWCDATFATGSIESEDDGGV